MSKNMFIYVMENKLKTMKDPKPLFSNRKEISTMQNKNKLWGFLFLFAAVLVLLNQFSIFQDISIWRILFTIALIIWLLQSIFYRSMTGILFSIAFLYLLYDEWIPLPPIRPFPLLFAAMLGSLGFHFLFPKKQPVIDKDPAGGETVYGSYIQIKTTMSRQTKHIYTDDFKQANIDCSMGSLKVYFDHATMLNTDAYLHILANMCSIELYVPKEWKIQTNCQHTFSSIQETGNPLNTEKWIRTEGNLSFSSIKIYYL